VKGQYKLKHSTVPVVFLSVLVPSYEIMSMCLLVFYAALPLLFWFAPINQWLGVLR